MAVTIWDSGVVGDLQIAFEWRAKPGEQRVQPMMRLRNPVQKRSQLIALSDAHLWDDRGTDTDPNGHSAKRRIMLQAIEMAAFLYDVPSRQGACRIVDAIQQYLPDLIAMPPRPVRTQAEWEREAQANKVVLRATQGGDSVTLIDFRTSA